MLQAGWRAAANSASALSDSFVFTASERSVTLRGDRRWQSSGPSQERALRVGHSSPRSQGLIAAGSSHSGRQLDCGGSVELHS